MTSSPSDALKVLLYEITSEYKIKHFEETGDVDFAYEIPGLARYRVNYFRQKNGMVPYFAKYPIKFQLAQNWDFPA